LVSDPKEREYVEGVLLEESFPTFRKSYRASRPLAPEDEGTCVVSKRGGNPLFNDEMSKF
jgi:hypothetical protein